MDRWSAHTWLAFSVIGGAFAVAGAGLVAFLLRSAAQVRSVPERMLESLLVVIPPQLFESALLRFGSDAKRYALWATSLCLLAALATLGSIALARRWSSRALLATGLSLWLLVMLVIMPLTGAGVLASELGGGTWAAVLGYLAVCLVYVSGLAGTRLALDLARRARHRPSADGTRRLALVATGTGLAALLSTYLLALVDSRHGSADVPILDPREPMPSGGLDTPSSHPGPLGSQDDSAVASAAATPATPVSLAPVFPEPRPARPMKRDKDGAVLPAGRRKGELTDLITSNDDFYVVSKNAGGDPILAAADWRLVIDGAVERPISLDYGTLRRLPGVETTKTLECISNLVARCELAPYGCDLISTARWKGVPVAELLRLAGGIRADAVYLATLSADEYTTAIPVEAALDPATLLVYEMNGEVLPREHGYPARLMIPGRYGLKSAKWVVGLRAMQREVVDWYGQRNWSKDAIVRTMSRIDVPAPAASLPPGDYNVAGIAYAGQPGISKVEYSADGGQVWHEAELIEPPLGPDTWVRWLGRFNVEDGAVQLLMSRATDGRHALQVEEFGLPQPDGSTGWPGLEVRARAP
jgi:DMSO/TMAO reductase YedYZ molybdopterin-dependent catalytic subunit